MNKKSSLTEINTLKDGGANLSNEFGTHFMVELIGCPPDRLEKVDDTAKVMTEVAVKSKSRMVGSCYHQFEPVGVSGVILIKWSHFSIHTWPEEGYAAADIFTCGEEMDPYIAMEVMKKGFGAKEARYQKIQRGF